MKKEALEQKYCPCYTYVDGNTDPHCPMHGAAKSETPKPLSVILDEIEERASKARPGPWEVTQREPMFSSRAPRNVVGPLGVKFESGVISTWIACPHVDEDADFIASARTDVPALVKALRRAILSLEYSRDHHINTDIACLADIAAILNQK